MDAYFDEDGYEKMDFESGDIIKWCDERYTVLRNYGSSGRVKDGAGQIIEPFYWSFGGIKSERIFENGQQN